MSDDVVDHAKAAMAEYKPTGASQFEDDRFIGLMRGIVPDLIAEVERLRALLKPHCTCNLGDAFCLDFHAKACALRQP